VQAFIVRPFGEKEGIDFDRVERELIAPALEALGIVGGTTAEIASQGNIRHDMFAKLLTADLVIADLSIHNANVFYELGIRHALRDKHTFLIRHSADEVPFDLKTDRYLSYDAERPGGSLDRLVEGLEETIRSEGRDSPVFQLLPDLEAGDPEKFLVVPIDFQEEVDLAASRKDRADLRRLAVEIEGLEWEIAGRRKIGQAQVDLGGFEGARDTWEVVRRRNPRDRQANLKLGTVFQKLGDLTRSSQALDRALAEPGLSAWDRAEARALQGSNEKSHWEEDWRKVEERAERQSVALRSPHLETALELYSQGFSEDRNHYYSGLNALALVTVLTQLAEAREDVWTDLFETDEDAARALEERRATGRGLAAAVELSLQSALERLEREETSEQTEDTEMWARVSRADLTCLTSRKPARVAHGYRRALADSPDFVWGTARKQLGLLVALGVLEENAKAAIEAIDEERPGEEKAEEARAPRVLLFTGHRIDAPDREERRFPADREEAARRMIQQAIVGEQEAAAGEGQEVMGLSGGASGGDILFHEECEKLGIATRMLLALPKDRYVCASVEEAGPAWVERFNRLYEKLDPERLSTSGDLPRWLESKKDYSIWQRSNLWMLYRGFVQSSGNLTLIALWDGEEGDGPGGTKDMVDRAREQGAKVIILDAKELIESEKGKKGEEPSG
jgi:tetratricopeptide (TPR) repeat protein